MANQIISLYLPEEVAMKLSVYCTERASNRSEVIRRAIEAFIDNDTDTPVVQTGEAK